MIERIVFLTQNRLYSRDYQRFGVELLRKNGFCVEIWELASILYPKFLQSFNVQDMFNGADSVKFGSKRCAYARLSALSGKDFVINFVSYIPGNLWVYRALSKSGADYAVMYTNSLPVPVIDNSLFQILMEKVRQLTSLRRIETWKRLYMKLPLQYLGVKPASLILAGGTKCFNYHYTLDKNIEVLQIHALDYDLYLKEKDSFCTEKPIAVFLDEFLPFHPDHIIVGGKSSITAEKYFSLLNGFFDFVEKETGLELVIAAHPKSDYENHPDYFKGRRCIKGKTLDLVRESKLVLAHASTSLNIANLFYKPIIFITCSDLDKTWDGCQIREMAKSFGKTALSMDENNNIDLKAELTVSKEHYDNYRRGYIKIEDSEELPFWQIVTNRLKKLM